MVSLLFHSLHCGAKATLIIAEVIPFFVLAVGVDNIFILVNMFERIDQSVSVDDRIVQALVHVGPSILLSSLCETIADFLLQVTCFVACMTLLRHNFSTSLVSLLDPRFNSFHLKNSHLSLNNKQNRYKLIGICVSAFAIN